jgi:hypothetical protein
MSEAHDTPGGNRAETLEAMRRRHWENLRRYRAQVEEVARMVVAQFQASGWDADVAAEGLGALGSIALQVMESLQHMRVALDEVVDAHQRACDECTDLLEEWDRPKDLDDLRSLFEEVAPRLFPWEVVAFAGLVNDAVTRYAPHEVATNGGGR